MGVGARLISLLCVAMGLGGCFGSSGGDAPAERSEAREAGTNGSGDSRGTRTDGGILTVMCSGDDCTPNGIACESSLDCVDAKDAPICDGDAKRCVECVGDADCDEGLVCGRNHCRLPCNSDNDCTSDGLLCDHEAGHCEDANAISGNAGPSGGGIGGPAGFDPSGGAGGTDPTGGAAGADLTGGTGGAGGTDTMDAGPPTGGVGGIDGTGGAAGAVPTGGTGVVVPDGGVAGTGMCDPPCTQECFPIGILACCTSLNTCGCTWAPGAFCL